MHNTFAREAVLEVGVGLHFRGFLINLVQNAVNLCHILCIHYKTNFLYSHGAGYRYFKDSSTVNRDLFCREKHSKSLYKLRTNATVRYSHYLRKNTKHSYLRAASTLVCTDFVIDEIEIWK